MSQSAANWDETLHWKWKLHDVSVLVRATECLLWLAGLGVGVQAVVYLRELVLSEWVHESQRVSKTHQQGLDGWHSTYLHARRSCWGGLHHPRLCLRGVRTRYQE